MDITQRRYKILSDFEKVSQLLRNNFVKYQKNGNMCQPRWEYLHMHPWFNFKLAHRFGVWEKGDEIVAVACYETDLGDCFLITKIGYEFLRKEMVDYAEQELFKINDKQKRELNIWVYDYETDVNEYLKKKNYIIKHSEPTKIYEYKKGFITKALPSGFSVVSLEDECDIKKINSVIWKGFNHGDTPDNDLDSRLHSQSAPNFRKDLTIVVKAPDGEYACFCGMWLDGVNDFAYLEPLATIPQYRGMGLATVALMESMKRTQKFGATYCFGGENEFYSKIGFEQIHYYQQWNKVW